MTQLLIALGIFISSFPVAHFAGKSQNGILIVIAITLFFSGMVAMLLTDHPYQ